MTTRRTPTQMAQDALDTAQRKVERADARVLLAAEWHQAYDPDPVVLTNRMRANDLRALLADSDSAKDEGGNAGLSLHPVGSQPCCGDWIEDEGADQ